MKSKVSILKVMEEKIRAELHEKHLQELQKAMDHGRFIEREMNGKLVGVDSKVNHTHGREIPTYVNHGYEELHTVLINALEQAQAGKGKERHAKGMPFSEQPIMRLPALQQNTSGLVYQACKKVLESENMAHEAKVRERLGAIVYIAASIIADRDLEVKKA